MKERASFTWIVACAGCLTVSCAAHEGSASRTPPGDPRPAAIRLDEGERRLIVAQGRKTPITLRVDPVTTGSRNFVMGTAEIAQGSRVPVHRHDQDELIFVHKGSPVVTLGDQKLTVEPGTTIFIPEGAWIGLENSGPEPVTFVWIFGRPDFESWVRATAVREGEALVEKTPAQVEEINRKHHMVFRR